MTASIVFNGSTSYVNCGSDASLANLCTGKAMTVDLWVRPAFIDNRDMFLFDKYDTASGGDIYLYFASPGGVTELDAGIKAADAYAQSEVAYTRDALWHHYTMAYSDTGDRKVYLAIDGAWAATYALQAAADGVVGDDSAEHLLIGSMKHTLALNGAISWFRISSGIRYPVGVNFTPPSRAAAPAVDGTTVELWAMDEGSGAAAAASVVTPANDGAMTDCTWEVDPSVARIHQMRGGLDHDMNGGLL